MHDLIRFLTITYLVFALICLAFCIEAYWRYKNRRGIDDDHDFKERYRYFGQPINNGDNELIGYELLLREYDRQSGQWRLPYNVSDYPLSSMVHTIKRVDLKTCHPLKLLALNMTVSQLTDYRAEYFFKWVLAETNHQHLAVEINASDLMAASPLDRWRLRQLLKGLDRTNITVTIEDVDSSKRTYKLLKPFLPVVDYLKFSIDAFKKSEDHWIDITLAQWQRQADRYGITTAVAKVEDEGQIDLVDQLRIPLRQGYAYGQPEALQEAAEN